MALRETKSLEDRLVARSDEYAKMNPIDTFDDYTGRMLLEAATEIASLKDNERKLS